MAKLPEIIRDFDPYSASERKTKNPSTYAEYRVPKDEKSNYLAVFRNDGKEQSLITMYTEAKEDGQVYSQKKSVPAEQQGYKPSTEQPTTGDYYFVPDAERSLNSNIARDALKVNNGGKIMPDSDINDTAVVKISDVMKRMQEAVKIPVRLGKITGGKAVQGQYYPKEEMIRLCKANDIATLSHEVGHHLEKVVFDKIGSDEVKQFYAELSPIASKAKSQTKAAVSAEGFAEFVSGYVTNPKSVAEKCPKF